MKQLKLFFALFAMLALGVGNVWGAETDTYDFKTAGVTKVSGPNSGNVTSSSGNVVLKSKTGNTTDTWTIVFTGTTAYGYGKNTGIYFGTNSYAPSAQMISKSYEYVSQVDIVTTTTNTSFTIGVKVGNSSFGEKTLGSCTSQNQTFTGEVTTGAITISITSPNKKQVKIEKIIITYGSNPEEGSGETVVSLIPKNELF